MENGDTHYELEDIYEHTDDPPSIVASEMKKTQQRQTTDQDLEENNFIAADNTIGEGDHYQNIQ